LEDTLLNSIDAHEVVLELTVGIGFLYDRGNQGHLRLNQLIHSIVEHQVAEGVTILFLEHRHSLLHFLHFLFKLRAITLQ
jgi:hypothetical protein